MLLREIKRRSNRFLGPSISICLVVYFAYHLVEGRRGLLAWQSLEARLARAQERLTTLKKDEEVLENRVKLLRPESICTDLLVERAKEVLGYVDPHEIVVMTKEK
jgi:cell division protein FtsB